MAPKKSKKISLNEFLGDSTLGSWADEMESLPNAPAARNDDDHPGDRFGRRGDDFLSSRPDRQSGPPREDVPIPSQPPYTAFVGNLAFDLTEAELGEFFSGSKIKTVKIIKDKDDKPKGFGYIEFEDVDGLKDALEKSGTSFSGRTVRVSVAEPPKERAGFGGSFEDNAKFDSPWRRDGPLPDLSSRDSSRRRFDGPPGDRPDRAPPSVSDGVDQWRSNRPARIPEADVPSFKRKGSGFLGQEGQAGAADREDVWQIGGKFKASNNGPSDEQFRSTRPRGDMLPPKETPGDDVDWRSSARAVSARNSISPSSSTPPTPQLARRKLELLPKTGNVSVTPSPLSSPKIAPAASTPSSRPNPFGAAKPVDVSSRDKEVTERIEKDRGATHEKLAMSRTSSRSGVERNVRPQTPPVGPSSSSSRPVAQKGPSLVPTVRPTLSFANVAAKKESALTQKEEKGQDAENEVEQISEQVSKVVL